MIIKRLPKLDEVTYKTYRQFYKDCLRYSTSDHSVFKTTLDHILISQNTVPQEEFKVFEYTLAEIKDAYLLELEDKLEEISKEINAFNSSDINLSKGLCILRTIVIILKKYL